jgi:hypothetical protein
VEAIRAQNFIEAANLAIQHLDEVEEGLDLSRKPDPLADLRQTLKVPPHSDAPHISHPSNNAHPLSRRNTR